MGQPARSDHPWRNRPAAPVPPPETHRECTECRQTLPLAQFRHRNGRVRERVCHDCTRARGRKRYHQTKTDDPDKVRQRRQRRYRQGGREYARRWREHRRNEQPIPRAWWSVIRAEIESGLSSSWLRQLAKAGRIVGRKGVNGDVGGRIWFIDPASLAKYMEERDGPI